MTKYFIEFEPVTQDVAECQACAEIKPVRLWMPREEFMLGGLETYAVEICPECENRVFRRL